MKNNLVLGLVFGYNKGDYFRPVQGRLQYGWGFAPGLENLPWEENLK